MFVQQKHKHGEIPFLMSKSKHVLFALGVNPTARDASEGGGSDLVSQATPFAVSCETNSRPCSLATQIYVALPSLARHRANAIEFGTNLSLVLADSTGIY